MYKKPLEYTDLIDQDKRISEKYRKDYAKEIKNFEKASELLVSLFSNAKRTYRDLGKRDYIQLVAVRVLQDARAALDLALKGWIPQSASLVRGTLESLFLIYDFKINPGNEDGWFDGSKQTRDKLFKAEAVRARLQEAGVNTYEPGKGLYNLLSDFSIHSNMESYIWYIEVTADKVLYHWAGRDEEKRMCVGILSSLFALAQCLFVLAEEDIYTFYNEYWFKDFWDWKKEQLAINKKLAKILGIKAFDGTAMPPYPEVRYVSK